MKTNTRTLFFLALSAILLSCNQGGVATTSPDDVKSKIDSKQPVKEISMNSTSLMSDTYVGSFLINNNDQFQAVYSSQNYGTFYQIYCKPHIAPNNKILDSLEFRIINYKGPLNIGFSENDHHKNEFGYDEGTLVVKLVVKGNSNENSKTIDITSKNIKKEDLDTLLIYRILLSLNEDKAMTMSGIFDSEFHTRSGFETSPKKLVPGLEGYSRDSVGGFNMDLLLSKNKLLNFGAGKNCYSALNTVMWH